MRHSIALAAVFAMAVLVSNGQVPELINFQGRLVNGTNLVNDQVGLTLSLYDAASGGTLLYADSNTVDVVDGLYSTFLGDDTILGSFLEVFTNEEVWVEIEVNGVTLEPREQIAAVGYALKAMGVSTGAITTAMLANGAVTTPKIAFGAVTSNKIAVGAVQGLHIAEGQVTGSHLATDTVAPIHLTKPYQSGSVSLSSFSGTNNTDFSSTSTNAVIPFIVPFDTTPIVTASLVCESDAVADAINHRLVQVTPTNFTLHVEAESTAAAQTLHATTYYDPWFSLVVINNNPAVAFTDEDSHLLFRRATDPLGISWADAVTVYTNDDAFYPSLALVNGNPAIAFSSGAGSDAVLCYVRALNAIGSAWGDVVELSTNHATLGCDNVCSLAVVAGYPAIAFQPSGDMADPDLQYVRATDVNGTNWGAIAAIADGGMNNDVFSPVLRIVNGNPAIAYNHVGSNCIFLIRGADIWGNTWNTPCEAVTNYIRGSMFDMEIINGNPAVSFYDDARDDLMYVRSSNMNGTAWSEPVQVATNGYVGYYHNLAAGTDAPALAFADTSNYLAFVKAADAEGDTWSDPVVISASNGAHLVCDMIYARGGPAIVWHGPDGDEVRFIRSGNLPADAALNWVAVEP
ncbi:MAG: hypothetical protein JXB04_01590 [Kiritimatiellae bacterium]|nr:hypothetical protein [Kiritimatiellia bacterium]